METSAWLLHFDAPKMRKSDQRSKVSLDIKVLTLDLKIAPHSSLLGHNAFVIDIVQLQKTYGLTTSSLTITIIPSCLSRPRTCSMVYRLQSFDKYDPCQYLGFVKIEFLLTIYSLVVNADHFCENVWSSDKIAEYSKGIYHWAVMVHINTKVHFSQAYISPNHS